MRTLENLDFDDDWGRPVYKDVKTGELLVDVNCGICPDNPDIHTLCNGEPFMPVENFIITGAAL